MKLSETQKSYQMSALQGASSIGLMIVLFDTLTGHLRRAAAALRSNDIEARCRDLDRALLVIGQLESWLDVEKGGESAQTMTRFYNYLRARMMQAALNNSAQMLEVQIDMILHVRSAWQTLDGEPLEGGENLEASAQHTIPLSKPDSQTGIERIPFSQSG